MWREPVIDEQQLINQKFKWCYCLISCIFYFNGLIAIISSIRHMVINIQTQESIAGTCILGTILCIIGIIFMILPRTLVKMALFDCFQVCVVTVKEATTRLVVADIMQTNGKPQRMCLRLPKSMQNTGIDKGDSLLIAAQTHSVSKLTIQNIIVLKKVISL